MGSNGLNFILQEIEEAWVLYQWTQFELKYGPNKQNDGVGTHITEGIKTTSSFRAPL